jgi:lipoate-protein ligase A
VVWHGKKLIGSAQVRRRKAMLQHGSVPLRGAIDAIVEVLRLDPWARSDTSTRLRSRATTLEAVLGRTVTEEEVAEALACGLAETLEVDLVGGDLTASESVAARSLEVGKYAAAAWNNGRKCIAAAAPGA